MHERTGLEQGATVAEIENPHQIAWPWALAIPSVVAFVLVYLGVRLLFLAGWLHGASEVQSPGKMLLIEAVEAGSVVLGTVLLGRLEHRALGWYGLGRPRVRQFATGALWGAGLLSLLVAVLWATHALVFTRPAAAPVATVVGWGAAWALVFLLTGVFEEVAFRGPLQFTLTRGVASLLPAERPLEHRKRVGFWAGAGALALLFGALHLGNTGEGLLGAAAAALVALVFAYSVWRTGSLWWAIGFHAAWDWAQSFVYGVADSGTVAEGTLLRANAAGSPWLSGGTVGPEGSVLVLPVIALAAAVVWWTLPGEAGSPSDPAYQPDA